MLSKISPFAYKTMNGEQKNNEGEDTVDLSYD